MIKAIVFDCFGVLATDAWLAFCDTLPRKTDFDHLHSLNRAYDQGIIDQATLVAEIEAATGMTPPLLDSMQVTELSKNHQLLTYIAELHKSYKIGLLSNISSDWITKTLLDDAEQACFDTFVLSYQVGMVKPDPRIFALVCERLGVELHEAVMVDDRHDFVEAAKGQGMGGIEYRNFQDFITELHPLLDTNE